MHSFKDIIAIWPSPDVMAAELGAKSETVRKWRQRDSIPADWWTAIIDAAQTRGATISADMLASFAARPVPTAVSIDATETA